MMERLDVLLVKNKLAASREKAKAAIAAGGVYADGIRQTKASALFEAGQVGLEIRGQVSELRYVSRGGLKLEKAVDCFKISLKDCVCMDIGASTGGFTDCMLQNGARKVYAIDVGSDQLSSVLREDQRVICMEKTNFRYLEINAFQEQPDFASADVSFISLTKILPAACKILKPEGEMVCLIKPQFEAGRGRVGKNGVVRDPAVHREVLYTILSFAKELGFFVGGLTYSPIRGPEGNIEYLAFFCKAEKGQPAEEAELISETVREAHARI